MMTNKRKIRITIEMDVEIDKDEYPELTEEAVEEGIVLENSDIIDGFEITTNIYGLDNTSDFFLHNGKIIQKELLSVAQEEDDVLVLTPL